MQKIFSFDPILGNRPALLILGSMPSARSLELREYYGHPRNHFWPVICALLDARLPSDYRNRTKLLKKRRIALWDIAQSCSRPGSLDSDMRAVRPNDIPALLRAHPDIRAVAFNGQTARKLYDRFFERFEHINYIALPSTSPIPTAACRNLDEKLAAWRALTPFLPEA